MDPEETICENDKCIHAAWERVQWQAFVEKVMKLQVRQKGQDLNSW
jgi:hypothetical protein